MTEGAEGIGPSKKDLEGKKPEYGKKTNEPRERHAKENAKNRHPSAKSVADKWTEKADENLKALGVTQEEIDRGIADTEQFLREQDKPQEPEKVDLVDEDPDYMTALKSYTESINSLFSDENFPNREKKIDKVSEKLNTNPETVGFDDLKSIIKAEKIDLEAILKSLGSDPNPQINYYITSKLARMKLIIKTLNKMLRGGKVSSDGEENLDLYLSDKSALPVFNWLYAIQSDYKPTKRKEGKR